MLKYRKATGADLEVCVELLGESFSKYDYMNIFKTGKDKQLAYITKLYEVPMRIGVPYRILLSRLQ